MARWDDEGRWWRDYRRSGPLAAKGGIKARSQRGNFAGSWWGKRWISVLESFGLGGRLTRGRSYARRGQVVKLEITPEAANAVVQGSRLDPYQVRISLNKIESKQRAALGEALAADMSIAARMVGGHLPPEIEQCFERAGAPLFPQRFQDLITWCSCPDSSNPCKHIAAVYYILAEEFDRDPFALLALRRLSREEFMELLSAAAPDSEAAQDTSIETTLKAQPLASHSESFWRAARLPDLTCGEIAPGEEAAPVARRLGAFPLWRGSADFLAEVGRLSRAAAARAIDILAGDVK
ncbi:MAG TPA: SWIM zinc finger family protein [Candidatus Binataceae bacterium]|nr:SWIM zinc finger family protein [Candidatus Binataceae bacterium]